MFFLFRYSFTGNVEIRWKLCKMNTSEFLYLLNTRKFIIINQNLSNMPIYNIIKKVIFKFKNSQNVSLFLLSVYRPPPSKDGMRFNLNVSETIPYTRQMKCVRTTSIHILVQHMLHYIKKTQIQNILHLYTIWCIKIETTDYFFKYCSLTHTSNCKVC